MGKLDTIVDSVTTAGDTDDGFKVDKEVCFNSKKVAKIFNVKKDHTFHPKDYHKFIANYYNQESNKSSNY